jgi:hypothetical protein
VVKIVSVDISKEELGAVSGYDIGFMILNSRELVSEIILDMSPEYYPYSLTAYPPTCSFYKIDALIATSCVVYGKSALRITPTATENLEQGVIYYIKID